MNYCGGHSLAIRSEEDGCTKDPLERVHEPAILGAALLHPEGVEHCRGTLEGNPPSLLANGHRYEEDRDQAVLAPGQAIVWVAGYLKNELAVPTFMKETSGRRPFDREPAENKRPGRESMVLLIALPVLSDHLNRLRLAEATFRNDQIRAVSAQQVTSAFEDSNR